MKLIFLLIVLVFSVPETINPDQMVKFLHRLHTNSMNHTINYYPGQGLGIKLIKDVHEGELVLMSAPSLSLSGIVDFAMSPYLKGLDSYIKLIGRILYEKFMAPRGAFLTEYVHTFPVKINTPTFWTEE